MSKEEEANVEDLSQTKSPPLYFAHCPFVSVLFLSHPYFVIKFFVDTCFQHPSRAATLSFSALIKASERRGLLLHS